MSAKSESSQLPGRMGNTRVPGPKLQSLCGPRPGPAGFYSLSPLIPAASVMKRGVSFLVSQGGNRDYGRESLL